MLGGLNPGTAERLLSVAPWRKPEENAALELKATVAALPAALGISW
jgi:hypothetical protein